MTSPERVSDDSLRELIEHWRSVAEFKRRPGRSRQSDWLNGSATAYENAAKTLEETLENAT